MRILAEPYWLGRSRAEAASWTRYESLLNSLFATWPATLVCPYDERSAPTRVLADSRRTHPALTGRDGSEPSTDYESPEQFLTAPH